MTVAENYTEIDKCRICGSAELTEVISLEPQFLSPTFVETNEGNELAQVKVPLTMMVCENPECSLVQLRETTNPELLYRNYFYRSSTNDMMKEDLRKVVAKSQEEAPLNPGDVVVDIGANDMTMIQWFPATAARIGVEPARNIDWSGVQDIRIVNDFFPSEQFRSTLADRKVKIFTSCAMFYDLDEPDAFVADIKDHLAGDGVWCIQLSYALLMLKNVNFYDICHEHLEYYSLKTLRHLMDRHGLHLYDAETNRVNGGSALVCITHKERGLEDSDRLRQLLVEEEDVKLYDVETYRAFYCRMQSLAEKVSGYIDKELSEGRKVLGLGASTKGNILLQFFGIDKSKLPAISERNPAKVGLRTLGSDMELISEEDARNQNPSCMLVLPWYFKEEIVAREEEYVRNGGVLLFPMPYAHLITKDGEVRL